MNVDDSININDLAAKSDFASGADIKSICTEAGMFAIRDNRDMVTMIDFERALNKVLETEETKVTESGVMFA